MTFRSILTMACCAAALLAPASTFKVLTVASALKNNKITENTQIYCPASITIDVYKRQSMRGICSSSS